jgi:hypothetical protein
VGQVGQRLMQFLGMERHALANGERRGVMVDAEGKDHRVGRGRTKGGRIITSGPVRPFAAPGSCAAPWLFGPKSTLIGQKVDKSAPV